MLAGENAMAAVLLVDLMVMGALFVFTAFMWPSMMEPMEGGSGTPRRRRMDGGRRV